MAVLLPLPLAGPYDYKVPDDLTVIGGDFVRVPLGNREMAGVVWGQPERTVDSTKLKEIYGRLDCPPMSEELRGMVDWMSGYYIAPQGAVMKMAMSVPDALEPEPPKYGYAYSGQPPSRMTAARQAVLDVVIDGQVRTTAEIAEMAGVSSEVVRKLGKQGVLHSVQLQRDPVVGLPDPSRQGPQLSMQQKAVADQLRLDVRDGRFKPTLLEGVTGSGKTEVYMEAVTEALKLGKQVLVLVPEIALTAQWLERFEKRYGCQPAAWHSDLTSSKRRRIWRGVAEGTVPVVVGARSALFLPYEKLGLVVVDEEHDGSFKQDDHVNYHARDMAVMRAKVEEIPVILASATPSLESLNNVELGRYHHLRLTERHGSAQLPEMVAIDMKNDPPERGQWLSPVLKGAILEALKSGDQAMLFLNRRGYAPLTLCRTCGHRLQCPNCTAWLVEHRRKRQMVCHHCGYQMGVPTHCPECDAEGQLVACGPGVERVAEEAMHSFPEAKVEVITSDTITSPTAAAALIERIQNQEIDIIVGTQVLAKGHNFPHLTVVGVVDADLGLEGGDLRAGERTYQLLSQVAGRAGRHEKPGKAFLQTYNPEEPVLAALISGDRDSFLDKEMNARQMAHMPPFGRLVALVISGPDLNEVIAGAKALAIAAPRFEDAYVLGPAPAPLAMLRGQHRYRLLLKAKRNVNVQALTRQWLSSLKLPKKVRLRIDMDPYSFL